MGAAAAGLLVGSCRSAAPPPPPATVPVPTPPTVAGPKDWAALNDALDGGVVLPSSSEYAAAKAVFNARFVDSTPAAIVAVASNDDVRRAMAFAADTHIDVAVRGGGHSYVGASSASGAMIMDLRRLPGGIVVDDATGLVTVSSAALLNSVHETLDRSGRTIPTGSCPTVGVSGLTLGGGLGPEARSLGLTCDALESAVVVLPSGDVVTAAADDHADLFWTLRGGGAAVGVVTSFTFRSSPAASRDVVSLTFPQDFAAQAIQAWHMWISAADRALWSMVNLSMGAPSGRFTIVLATPEGDGPRRATNLAAAIGVAPLSSRNPDAQPDGIRRLLRRWPRRREPARIRCGFRHHRRNDLGRSRFHRGCDDCMAPERWLRDGSDRVAQRSGERRRTGRKCIPVAAIGGLHPVVCRDAYTGTSHRGHRMASRRARSRRGEFGGRLRQLRGGVDPSRALFRHKPRQTPDDPAAL